MSEGKELKVALKEEPLKPQKRLSPTSINTYFECPRKYFYTYIAKIKIKPSIHLVKGMVVHKALEDFFRGYRKNLEEHMVKRLENAWKKHYKDLRDLELPAEELETAKEDCLGMVTEYYIALDRKMKMLQKVGKASNEAHAYYLLKPKFRELWIEDKDLHLCGYIDRVHQDYDGIVTLGDYKTSSKYGVGLESKYKRQLALYSLLYANKEKSLPHYVAVIFLRYGEEYLLEVTPSLLKLARETVRYVYGHTRSVDIEDYPLKEGKLCRWCTFNKICSGEEEWEKVLREQKLKKIVEEREKKEKKEKSKKVEEDVL